MSDSIIDQSAWDAVRGSEPAYTDLDETSRNLLSERATRAAQEHTVTDSDTVQGRFECEVLRQMGIEPLKSTPALKPKAKAAPKAKAKAKAKAKPTKKPVPKKAVKKAAKKPAPKVVKKPVRKPKLIKKGAKKR